MFFSKIEKFVFLIFLSGVIFTGNFRAQTPICNLQFEIFEFTTEKSAKKKAVNSANTFLTELATGKTIESSASVKSPLFTNLISGKYKIEVVKNDYQRRIKEIDLVCNSPDEVETISKFVFLRKGNSNETTKFGTTIYGVKDNTEQDTNKSNEIILNGSATLLSKPNYPAAARAVRATGAVQVQVTIDEDGDVLTANAISGHPLLRRASEKAARESRFTYTILEGQPVKIKGVIVYNFIP